MRSYIPRQIQRASFPILQFGAVGRWLTIGPYPEWRADQYAVYLFGQVPARLITGWADEGSGGTVGVPHTCHTTLPLTLNHGALRGVGILRDLGPCRLRRPPKRPPKQQFIRAVEPICRPQSRPVDIARQPTLRLWAAPVAAEPDEARTGAASKDPGRCPHSPPLAGYGRSDHGFRPARRLNRQDDDQKHGPSAPCSYHSRAHCAPDSTGRPGRRVTK